MKNLNHLGISGGGTKIAGLFGAAEVIMKEKGYKPHIISGISAGAILSVPLALGKFDQVKKLVLNARLSDFFSAAPVNENGSFKIGAILKAIAGKPYLGKQENLEATLSKVVSKQEFEAYKNNPSAPVCIVGTVNFYDASRWYFNLKEDPEIDYARYLKLVNASASLPLFTNGIQLKHKNNNLYLYDGGVRDHCPTAYILKSDEYIGRIAESISLYSRPKDYKLAPDSFSDQNVIKILERYVDITNIEVSKNDELQEQDAAGQLQVKLWQVFVKRAIMHSVYDTDAGRLQTLYTESREEAKRVYPGLPAVA